MSKPTYCLGLETVRRVAQEGHFETEKVDFVAADSLFNKEIGMTAHAAARLAHEVNRAYCLTIGDLSQLAWDSAPEWQRQSAINGIMLHWVALAEGKEVAPAASHESWLAEKLANGWKYGSVKDPEKKEHPCCVPYSELPAAEKAKDYLFGAVAKATFVI